MSDSESQGNHTEANLPQGVPDEPLPVQADATEGAKHVAPESAARDAHFFRWRDLAYVLLFYLIVGAGLAKLALVAAAAMLHTTEEALQEIPAVYVAVVAISQVLVSAALLGFLWLLVRSRGRTPFWPALGWRALSASPGEGAGKTSPGAGARNTTSGQGAENTTTGEGARNTTTPRAALAVRYMLGGAALALVIQAASAFAGTKNSVPMEDLFRDRPSVLMMMALGILVAPLVEETLFRGCIFPVVSRTFGMPAGILATGILFGLAHSPQLAGAWVQVALVMVVGVVLTWVRARAGTVLASFFVHFGYNTFLFGAFYVATRGLRYFPGS